MLNTEANVFFTLSAAHFLSHSGCNDGLMIRIDVCVREQKIRKKKKKFQLVAKGTATENEPRQGENKTEASSYQNEEKKTRRESEGEEKELL